MRSTISTVLKASPGALVFSFDELLNTPLTVEWQTITHNREELVNDVCTINKQSMTHQLWFCFRAMSSEYNNTIKGRLAVKTCGPFEIVHVHMNGTTTIQLRDDVTEWQSFVAPSLIRTFLCNWYFSYSGGECVIPTKITTCVPIPPFMGFLRFLTPKAKSFPFTIHEIMDGSQLVTVHQMICCTNFSLYWDVHSCIWKILF